nr:AraC family transcriptional regulator [Pedobacter panaciterrae]
MRYVRELSNRNRISCDTVRNSTAEMQEDHHTFKFVFKGQQDYLMAKRKVSIFPDSFLFLPPGTNYTSIVDSYDPVDVFSVSVSANFLSDFHNSYYSSTDLLLAAPEASNQVPEIMESFYPFSGDMRFTVMHLYQRLIEGEADELLINEYLHHCLLNFYRIRGREINSRMERLGALKASTRQELFKRLILAKEFISNNYNKKFNLNDVARFSCLSVNHLLRTFKEAYGISPYQFLTQVRLDRAKYFLEHTDYQVAYTSMLVGFESVSSFIRVFKSTFNVTPLKYKNLSSIKKPC